MTDGQLAILGAVLGTALCLVIEGIGSHVRRRRMKRSKP